MSILVTGASGFVGTAVTRLLTERAIAFRAAVRKASGPHQIELGELSSATCWAPALHDCCSVIHLAARVHKMEETAGSLHDLYHEANVATSLNLARQAAQAGVRTFVFVSSIKVNGEESGLRPYLPSDPPNPGDAYAISKRDAEAGLMQLSQETGMRLIIVRPPLVYGPGVRANFLSLLQAVFRGWPLPLGAVRNERSMVYVDNLADLLIRCATADFAENAIFLASDGHDISTPELVRDLAHAMGRPARLVPVPPLLLKMGATLLGKGDRIARVLGNLQVNTDSTRALLNWSPPISYEEGIGRTVDAFLSTRSHLSISSRHG
jgi:nucleoside-diphosphate-sugar epimerase